MQEEQNIGKKLTEAHANVGKIIFRFMLRFLLAGIIVLAGVRSNPPQGPPSSVLAVCLVGFIVLAAVLWVSFPLIHCRDMIAFYENGIVIRKRPWMLTELGQISFMEVKSSYSLFARTYMCTEVRNFDITYIKNGKKNFNRAYFESI
ncbi:MAG: hypothetical protein HFH48_10150 [Lachnospiraceae bacterium]|nr:hypothetical protein [Lachnospiraceae bacterium]